MSGESSQNTAGSLPQYPIVTNQWCVHFSEGKIHPPDVYRRILPRAVLESKLDLQQPFSFEPNGGMLVPFEVKYSDERGRGVYATEEIEAGTVIWKTTHEYHFHDADSFTAFLKYLPPSLQCDVILWAYPAVVDGLEFVIAPLDEGGYINHGDTKEVVNVDRGITSTRTIHPGDEILQDYCDLGVHLSVEWFDELMYQAWGDEDRSFSCEWGDEEEQHDTYDDDDDQFDDDAEVELREREEQEL